MPPEVSHRSRRLGWLASGALGLGALTYVGLVDPHRPGAVFPPCPFKMITGWDCPACGGLRMTNDLLHGNVSAAVVDNVFLLAGLPLLAIWSLVRVFRARPVLTPAFLIIVVIAATVWTVIRNLPGFPLVPTMLGP
jgi:hypothetical protein